MLKPELNVLLTRTDAGTAMGRMFRSYWIPALLADELPENDGPPVRVALLGEKLLALRDTSGRMGLIEEFCAHRRTSLWFGRNEEGGIRCAYHGWKYDVTGQCIEVPSEGAETGFCRRIKLASYPLIARGDILWTYMGPPDKQPPLPEFEFALVASEQRFVSKRLQECNWLQALEGGIDSSHVSFLHRAALQTDPLFKGAKGNQYNLNDAQPHFEVAEAPGGLFIGARRQAENGNWYWRITPWVMPCFTLVPPRADHPIHGHFWIPIDDENCWVFTFDYHPTRPLSESELRAMRDGHGVHNQYVPGTYRPLQNKDNDYLIDREAQRRGETYSGVSGIAMQDAAMQESMGPIVNRTKERLVATDVGIMKARNMLHKAALALRDEGTPPPGVATEHHLVRSFAVVLPKGQPYMDVVGDAAAAEAGKQHVSV